jgi:hypothetical protein
MAKLFDEIGEYLRDAGYSFVVEEVREELATGRLTEERISTLAEVFPRTQQTPLFDADFQKGVPADFVRRAEYSEDEAVALLLEAAKRAVCEGAMIAEDVRAELSKQGISAITFVAERDDGPSFSLRFDQLHSPAVVREAAVKLDELAQQIRSSS